MKKINKWEVCTIAILWIAGGFFAWLCKDYALWIAAIDMVATIVIVED